MALSSSRQPARERVAEFCVQTVGSPEHQTGQRRETVTAMIHVGLKCSIIFSVSFHKHFFDSELSWRLKHV